jgi:fructose-bisphosphate aldolase class II
MEIVQGITRAAKKLEASRYSAVLRKRSQIRFKRLSCLLWLSRIRGNGLPIALHLDHARILKPANPALTAVHIIMIDGSSLPYEENVALTKKVVEYAHAHGVTVEGELGNIAALRMRFPLFRKRFIHPPRRGLRFCNPHRLRFTCNRYRHKPRRL